MARLITEANLGKIIAATIIVGMIWVTLIAGTQLLTRPPGQSLRQKGAGALVVTLCSLVVAVPLAVGARLAFDTQKLVSTVFADESDVQSTSRPTIDAQQKNPLEKYPRLNFLLVGVDSNAVRIKRKPELYSLNSVRTDTIMVASIDTATGTTTIIQLPRNLLRAPFAEGSAMAKLYPNGFEGPGGDDNNWLTELWAKARNTDYPEIKRLFEQDTYPGAELLKQGAEGITGLKIDYFALLNTDGLQQLIDAMGGVTVNINEALPKGTAQNCNDMTKCLAPGEGQHLNGYDAMWYARSRKTSNDYARMARQSCLVSAIISQSSPTRLLTSYEAITSASADMIVTDIPQQVVEPIVQLALKVKDARIKRLVFTLGRDGYDYPRPNFQAMRRAVAIALDEKSPAPTPQQTSTPPTPAKTSSPPPKPTVTKTSGGTEVVTDACAYQPTEG